MGSGKELDREDVRKRLKPETAKAVLEAVELGYTVRAQGHCVRVYCPCGGPHVYSVSGTPRDDRREANRLRREVRRCKAAAEITDV